MKCDICQIGNATQIEEETVTGLALRYHLCDYCGSEFATPHDLRYNKAKKTAHGKIKNNGNNEC